MIAPIRATCAVAARTGWDPCEGLDDQRIFSGMERPPFNFDGGNILDQQRLFAADFNVLASGRRQVTHL